MQVPEISPIAFTSAEREAFEERQGQVQAEFERMAAGRLEEQQRIGAQMWARNVEGPRMARRIAAARRSRRVAPRAATRARECRPGTTRRTSSSSSTSSSDPGDDSGDSEPPAVEPWRWADPASWRSFVASIASRDFEREVARERMAGWLA